ncbi:restriction endonuclease [Paenibacillus sp. 22594]|uniref:restriction endonuclease n=1 Tax=Paenibacillus sp. 22594 TaxID=3453947 RepID=UPI003F878CE9
MLCKQSGIMLAIQWASALYRRSTHARYYKAKRAIVIATAKFTEPCETLAGINHVKLLDRTDLMEVIEAFRRDDLVTLRDIIEGEPRMILESWLEANHGMLNEIRKDYKAEKYVKKIM